jgi:hypothetical protein
MNWRVLHLQERERVNHCSDFLVMEK